MKHKKYTYEDCQQEALKYSTKTNFHKGNQSVYNSAKNNGWLNDICSHMKVLRIFKPQTKYRYSYEDCEHEALKYNTKKEFYTTNYSIYNAAHRNNWINDICSHMKKVGDKYNRCIYAYIFEEYKSVYVGLTYDINSRHKSHITTTKSTVYRYSKMNDIDIPKPIKLIDYLPITEAKLKEGEYLEYYKNKGYYILNKNKTGGVGSSKFDNIDYTKDYCLTIAKPFSRICDFRIKYSPVFNVIKKEGWYNDAFEHIINKRKIVVFDYDGNFIQIYSNQKNSGTDLNFDKRNITSCLKNINHSTYKYRFMRYLDWLKNDKPTKLPEIVEHPNKRKIISIKNDIIQKFDSIEDGVKYIKNFTNSKIETIRSSIAHVCLKKRKTAYGYKWIYEEELKIKK